jgi:hypothetical protein
MRTNFTRHFTFVFFALLGTLTVYGQNSKNEASFFNDDQNLVKFNFGALALKNFSFQYERAVSKKIAVAMGLRFMPSSSLPFSSALEKQVDAEAWDDIKHLKLSNFAVTPEVRFYMGKEAFRGFYLAPFVRYSNHPAKGVSFSYTYSTQEDPLNEKDGSIVLNGNLSTFTGGLLIGSQWKLSKAVYFDWWILGPQYGSSSGKISGNSDHDFSAEEREALSEELTILKTDLNDSFLNIKSDYQVEGDRASMKIKGPWAGVRAGLCLGYRF